MNFIEFTVLKAFKSEFKLRTNPVKAFNGTCVRLTSITFPVIWSSVLWLVYKFFLINNIELKCSFVRCRKYYKSWSNGAAELHILVDLLCVTTVAELHNSVNLPCGTMAAELNPVWCKHRESQTFSKDSDEPCWKIWKLNPNWNLAANFWKINALDDSANTDRCKLYKDSANFLKDERFTKTEYQTSANLWKMNAEDTSMYKNHHITWVSASKGGKT